MNDLATLTHAELTALLSTLDSELVQAEKQHQTMRVINIEHEMSAVRAQLAKVKAKVDPVEPQAEQPKLF